MSPPHLSRAAFRGAFLPMLLMLIGFAGVYLYAIAFGYGDVNNPDVCQCPVQYLWLADSFLHGKLDLSPEFVKLWSPMDTVLRDGRYYWPLGPLPAVLFMPFVAIFGKIAVIQGIGQLVLAAAVFVVVMFLARREGFTGSDPLWLAVALCFGSFLVGVIDMAMPWHLSNLLTVLCMLVALLEWRGRNRPLAVGIALALAVASRPQAAIPCGFFFLFDILTRGTGRNAWRRLTIMAAPIIVTAFLLGVYNAARFGDPFDTGQRAHFLGPGAVSNRRDDGIFDLRRIPSNFYWYFLALPELRGGFPVIRPEGASAVLLSPVFLWLFFARPRKPEFVAASVVTAASLAMYLSYFGTGFTQFGPRYLTDVLPLWFFVLLGVFRERRLIAAAKATITASVAANAYLFYLFAVVHVYFAF